MKDLPKYCPQCMREWSRRQSPWFRHTEYVYCENCNANAETIIKRCEKDPSLKKKQNKINDIDNSDWFNKRDWYDYWRD